MTELLTTVWDPPGEVPEVGDVLLAAAGSIYGELPALRVRPAGGTRSAHTQHPGVAQVSVHEQQELINPSAAAARDRLGVPPARHAVVVLVDGLGWHNLHDDPDLAPFLTSQFQARIGRSAIPSTTATNITYLGTGSLAGQTRMAGYTVRNPETSGVFNLISWAGGMHPPDWQRTPTVFERLAAADIPTSHVSTWRFENSGLTQAALRGAHYVSAETLAERVAATVAETSGTEGRLSYLYWAEVDAAGHQFGWRSTQWRQELRDVDEAIQRLVRGLPPDTLVFLTADHGMVDVPQGRSACFGGPARIDIATESALRTGVDLVAGENRFLHLFSDTPAEVAHRWREYFGPRAVVWQRAEAFASGIFGPVREDAAEVFGDVMVALLGDISVGDRRTMSEAMFTLPGLHGSVTEWERAVPILWHLT